MADHTDTTRPRAFEYRRDRYQWQIGRAPKKIRCGNQQIDNPFFETAVFVVHGIGDQKDVETAAAMRWGIEDSLPLLRVSGMDPANDNWTLPAPYVNDGHWAEYDNLETFVDDIRQDLDHLTARQRAFFTEAWRSRTRGWFRSWTWIVAQGLKLVLWGSWLKKPFYILLTVLMSVLMLAACLWPPSRKFIVTYVNDARLYMEPKGDIEHEIVQLIDRRVARAFLATIGKDIDFGKIEPYAGVLIDGEARAFKHVTWVAHSLGTIISFNVIGDILSQCWEVRRKHADKHGGKPTDPCPKVEDIERALTRFVTIGSPLDKVCFLYAKRKRDTKGKNLVLRKWPEVYLPGQLLDLRKLSKCMPSDDKQDSWWTNIFYGSDPVSGPLDTIEEFLGVDKNQSLIQNVSSFGLRAPLASHTGYWNDTGTVSKVIAQAYTGFTRTVWYGVLKTGQAKKPNTYFVRAWPTWLHGLLSAFGLFWLLAAIVASIVASWVYRDAVGSWFDKLF